MHPIELVTWGADWLWSVPLLVLCTVFHVFALGLVIIKLVEALSAPSRRRSVLLAAVAIGGAVVLTTALHAVEAGIWAWAFWRLGALPDVKSAMLYSLGAMTTYGHAQLVLSARWQLMGAIEALNGLILFGLTTAFLFAMIQRVWGLRGAE